jgi:thioredoxin reductase/bacterioferritin-associated ferredoxin
MMAAMVNDAFDLIVIGSGPAGAEAALAAASFGLSVVLLDEGPEPGGQVWRAPRTNAAKSKAPDADRARGDDLRYRIGRSSVQVMCGVQVWDVRPGFAVSCVSAVGGRLLTAPRVVLATGAIERVLPFDGWTTPGVFGLAAATALIKSEGVLAGKDIIIAGQGPLLIAVAAKALSLGKVPLAIIDRASAADWGRALLGFAHVPSMAMTGARWMAQVKRAGVPILRHSAVVSAKGGNRLTSVSIRHLTKGTTTEIGADTLYIGNGLAPGDDIHRLLGLAQQPDVLRGGYRTECDSDRRSSLNGLYVAGDGAGVHGALPSGVQGRLAGLAAALDHGAMDAARHEGESRPLKRRLRRLVRFADASCNLMRFPAESVHAIPATTIVCRCEDVTAGDILQAQRSGACDINQLKHFTRLGMGPCQGRLCAMNAVDLLRAGAPQGGLRLTPRAPVRPIEMEALIGTFDYADIPVPKPAPL